MAFSIWQGVSLEIRKSHIKCNFSDFFRVQFLKIFFILCIYLSETRLVISWEEKLTYFVRQNIPVSSMFFCCVLTHRDVVLAML